MPELPEVEAARRLVEAHCVGAVVVCVEGTESGGGPRQGLFDEIVCEGFTSATALEAALLGRRLLASHRVGKQMWWELTAPGSAAATADAILWHFGMSGSFAVCKAGGTASASQYKRVAVDLSQWPPRFTKVEVVFDNGVRLAFANPRRLGRVRRVSGTPMASPPLSLLGPDALRLEEAMPLAAFAAGLSARTLPIKALLLDQAFIAGVGNYLADEALYQAAIHPETAANALAAGRMAALHAAIARIVAFACSVDADYTRFPKEWLFHVRWGKGRGGPTPRTVDGHAVTFVTVGGRTSAVVTAVQGSRGLKCAAGAARATSATRAAAAADDASPQLAAVTGGKRRFGAAASVAASAPIVVTAAAAPPSGDGAAGGQPLSKRSRRKGAAFAEEGAAAGSTQPEDAPARRRGRHVTVVDAK